MGRGSDYDSAVGDAEPPKREAVLDGFNVWWEPLPPFSAQEVEAELPDGTHLRPVIQLGGRRLGFDRRLAAGTPILLRGEVAWIV